MMSLPHLLASRKVINSSFTAAEARSLRAVVSSSRVSPSTKISPPTARANGAFLKPETELPPTPDDYLAFLRRLREMNPSKLDFRRNKARANVDRSKQGGGRERDL